jgi:hypothetical protein
MVDMSGLAHDEQDLSDRLGGVEQLVCLCCVADWDFGCDDGRHGALGD